MRSISTIRLPTDKTGKTSDPYLLRQGEWYYHCYTAGGGIYIAKTKEFSELEKAESVRVYSCKSGEDFSEWYAPELHLINGTWYIYGSPKYKGTHIMAVLENKNPDPMTEFSLVGLVEGLGSNWNLDGTVTEYDGKNWFIWSGGAALFIAELISPNKVSGIPVKIKETEFEFERRDNTICEGPAVLKRGEKIHLIYSVNNSMSDEYCLGRITFSGKGDILDMSNWEKCETAVFEKTEDIFGPGHCSFTTVLENGKWEDYIIYHANLESGSGWYGRSVWAQKVEWDENDTPIFGVPHR